MDSPKVTYESMKRINNIDNIAYERLFENYLKFELKGSKKLIEVDSTDQESVLNRILFGLPQEGMIYTFIHMNEKNLAEIQNYKTGKVVQFHDFTPIVFCTRFVTLSKLLKGINLNILPPSERLKFFQAYWEYYKEFFDRIEEKTEYNKEAINNNYKLAALIGKNPELFKIFNNRQNAVFEYAYRTYNLNNIAKFRMIEYEEWRYVPFLNAQQSFKKINLEQLYRTYWDNKNKKI